MLSRTIIRLPNRRVVTRSIITHLLGTDAAAAAVSDRGTPSSRLDISSVRHQQRAIIVTHQQQSCFYLYQWRRSFHSSPVWCDDGEEGKELSAKEKKKMLKAKAKAIQAEKDKEKEEAEETAAPAKESPPAVVEKVEEAPESAEEPQKDESTPPPPPPPATTEETLEEEPAAAPAAPSATTEAASADEGGFTPPYDENGVRQYSYPELTADAARHKAGLQDPDRPDFQNPLHHNNPDTSKLFREDYDTEEEFQANVQPLPPLDDPSGSVTAPPELHELADEMVNLTMLEMSELINKIAEHYNFHEGMMAPGMAEGVEGEGGGDEDDEDGDGAGGGGGGGEQTAFDVKLVGFDAKAKIKIIKEARSIVPGLGLKEAKELVESAPISIIKGVSKENAEEIKEKLAALGAEIEIV